MPMCLRAMIIALICIFFTLGCKYDKSFDLGTSTYSSNHIRIDSISSFNTEIIFQAEYSLNVRERTFLSNDDYCFRFWIGHSLGLKLYCIEILQVNKQYYLSLATFSKSESEYFKVESIKHTKLKIADYLHLRDVIQEQKIKSIYNWVLSGIGEPGADGAWIYFQYFSQKSLKLIPIDCYECLGDGKEKNGEIIKIVNSLTSYFDSNFSGYIKNKQSDAQ